MDSFHPALRAWILAFAGIAACSTVRREDDGEGGSAAGGQASCEEEPPTAPLARVAITIYNDTGSPVFIPNGCGFDVPDGITLDGKNLFAASNIVGCEEAFDGVCVPPPIDCARAEIGEIPAHSSRDFLWDGRLPAEVTPPAACVRQDCAGDLPLTRCMALTAVPAGDHTFDISFRRGTKDAKLETFPAVAVFPIEALIVTIGP